MAVSKTKDTRFNIAAIALTESAANTQTSLAFAFPFSVMDKMALNICRIEYWLDGGQLNSTGDWVCAAISTGKPLASILDQTDPGLLDSHRIMRRDFGAAASGFLETVPFVKDFSNMPGGGILCAPSPLYAVVQSFGAAAANSAIIKLFYTYMQLSTDEYWELVESRRIISS